MIDTIKIAWRLDERLDTESLIERGWECRYNQYSGQVKNWVFRAERTPYTPRLTVFKAKNENWYCTVHGSLPAFLLGSNAQLLDESQTVLALESLSAFVSSALGQTLSPQSGSVWEVDYASDLLVDDQNIYQAVNAIATMDLAGFRMQRCSSTTVYFFSVHARTMRSPHVIAVYSKQDERISGRASTLEIEQTAGILRLENRFRKRKTLHEAARCRGIANSDPFTITSTHATKLFLDPFEAQFRKVLENPSTSSPVSILIDKYGCRGSRGLFAFLYLAQEYGPDFPYEQLGYSKSTYYENKRKCREAGISPFGAAKARVITVAPSTRPPD